MIRVLLPYTNYPGGPGTFIRNLTRHSDSNVSVLSGKFDVKKIDILLILTTYNLSLLILSKLLGKKIILRLGKSRVFYVNKNLIKSLRNSFINLSIIIIYVFFADLVIFQSEFSKKSYRYLINLKKTRYEIIYNGISTPSTFQYRKKVDKNIINFIHWSSGVYSENIQFIRSLIDSEALLSIELSFILIGSLPKDCLDIKSQKNVVYYEKLENRDLFDLDFPNLVYFSMHNSANPNSVIEAMSMGIPILSIEGNPLEEILTKEIGIYIKNDLTSKSLNLIFDKIINDYEYYSKKSIARYNNEFNSKKMFDNYSLAFESIKINNR